MEGASVRNADSVELPANNQQPLTTANGVTDVPATNPAVQAGPVTAMPALDTLDMTVLDQLPAAMRLELMKAYGLHSMGVTPCKRRNTRSNVITSASKKRPAAVPDKVTEKKPAVAKATPLKREAAVAAMRGTVFSDAAAPSTSAAVAPTSAAAEPDVQGHQAAFDAFAQCRTGRGLRCGVQGLTLSQLDPETLQELPEDVRQSIVDSLPRSRADFVDKAVPEGTAAGSAARGTSLVHQRQVCVRAVLN